MNPQVVAVTGAYGYVGSVISGALSSVASVVSIDMVRRSESDIAWSFDADPETLATALRERGVRKIIHAAWDMLANSPAELERGCVAGSRKLLQAASAAGIEKVIFVSTISAFSGARSAYGRSKLMVERAVQQQGGIVLRFGLIYGAGEGGVFGNLRNVVRKAKFIPMIGDGRAPQYLLHEITLGEVVRLAVRGDFDSAGRPLTFAHPKGIAFQDMLRIIAESQESKIVCVPVPWRLLYAGIRAAEMIGLKLKFRSDSVISFVYQDPSPDFGALSQYGVEPVDLAGR